ncbi:MAG: protease pro-enzyme activation domain-containing protein [Actinomycetota bacterium]|nr:protease pro-enzyme activation domain-containing protein [Actinomycetota bacterium]
MAAFASAAVLSVVSLVLPVATTAATASPLPMAALQGATLPSPAVTGARTLSGAPAAAPMHLAIAFKSSHPSALSALAAAVSTPGSASFHQFVTVGQFRRRFGAAVSRIAATDAYLSSKGLAVGRVAPNGLYQDFSGTASQVSVAFGITVERVRSSSGAVVVGATGTPSLPADLAASVSHVAGLQPWVQPVSSVSPASGPSSEPVPATSVPATASAGHVCPGMAADRSWSPGAMATQYRFGGFYSAGHFGGVPIGLIEFAGYSPSDVAAYKACVGASTPVFDHTPASAPSLGAASAEPTSDIEDLIGLAPASPIEVYQGAPSDWSKVWNAAVSQDVAKIISSSWGTCEASVSPAAAAAQDTLMQEAAVQGQTVFQASGDQGAQGCSPRSTVRSAVFPASDPYVTAVGGTTASSPSSAPVMWNGGAVRGATGGGESALFGEPSWQASLGGAANSYETAPYCTSNASSCRQVPDVSALAGNGYDVYCTACSGWPSGWSGVGGTSLAAPSWAAAAALESGVCSTPLGFVNPVLYSQSAAGPAPYLSAVTSGSNNYSGAPGSGYSAQPSGGYSPTDGLGSLGGGGSSSGLGSALCSSSSPVQGQPGSKGGYYVTTSAGGVFNFGLPWFGSSVAVPHPPVVAVVADPSGGYWQASSGGNVYNFHTGWFGSLAGRPLASPVVGMAATPDGKGYWLVTSKGNVFNFGDARWAGSPAQSGPGSVVTAIAASPTGGYWVLDSTGHVTAYGGAQSYGSAPSAATAVALAPSPTGHGYWVTDSSGAVRGFGDARVAARTSGPSLASGVVGMVPTGDGGGYWLVNGQGAVAGFGDATGFPAVSKPYGAPVVGIAASS